MYLGVGKIEIKELWKIGCYLSYTFFIMYLDYIFLWTKLECLFLSTFGYVPCKTVHPETNLMSLGLDFATEKFQVKNIEKISEHLS